MKRIIFSLIALAFTWLPAVGLTVTHSHYRVPVIEVQAKPGNTITVGNPSLIPQPVDEHTLTVPEPFPKLVIFATAGEAHAYVRIFLVASSGNKVLVYQGSPVFHGPIHLAIPMGDYLCKCTVIVKKMSIARAPVTQEVFGESPHVTVCHVYPLTPVV